MYMEYSVIGKHVWYLVGDKHCLWVKWIHGVYLKKNSLWDTKASTNSWWYWQKIIQIKDRLAIGYIQNQWGCSSNRKYTITSGYKRLLGAHTEFPMPRIIWERFNIPNQTFCFLRICLGKLSTRDRILSWNHQIRSACVFYVLINQKPMHIFSTNATLVKVSSKMCCTLCKLKDAYCRSNISKLCGRISRNPELHIKYFVYAY